MRWILRIVEASALFLFAAALVLCAIPFFAFAVVLFAVAAAVDSRRADRRLALAIRKRRVLVFFSPLASAAMPSTLAADYTVLVVTPLLSAPQTGRGRFSIFSAAAFRTDGVILVREYYYFHLVRTLLPHAAFCARIY